MLQTGRPEVAPYQVAVGAAKFDSVIVVTDRINLDKQIRDNINAFAKLKNLVGWADHSVTLRELLTGGKKIIVSTIQTLEMFGVLRTIRKNTVERADEFRLSSVPLAGNGG